MGQERQVQTQQGIPLPITAKLVTILDLTIYAQGIMIVRGGTFLTEDSYPGEDTDPLSLNRYSYVQNNPVNYTDPSGHFWSSIKKGWNYVKKTASNAWNGVKRVASNTWNTVKRVASNTWNTVKRVASNTWNGVKSFASKAWNATKSAFNHATNWVSTQYNRASNWVGRQWNKVQTAYNSAVDYVQTKYQQTVAQIEAKRQQVVRSAYALATGIKSSPTIREGLNLLRNWNTALQNTLKHVCDPKTTGASDKGENKVPSVADFRKYEDAARHGLRPDQKERIDRMTLEEYLKAPPMTPEENAYASNVKFAKFNQENKATLPTIAAELIGWNNGERLVTGKDPLTGEDANRWVAGAELAVDIASNFYPMAKAGKLRKLEKALDAVDAVNDVSKATKTADKASDVARVADKVDDVNKGLRGSKKLDEFPQHVQDAYNGYSRNNWTGTYKGQSTGTKAGGRFKNNKNYLPNVDANGNTIMYREFDINSKIVDSTRDAERFVKGSDGSLYYTDKHYEQFIRVK